MDISYGVPEGFLGVSPRIISGIPCEDLENSSLNLKEVMVGNPDEMPGKFY